MEWLRLTASVHRNRTGHHGPLFCVKTAVTPPAASSV